MCCFSSDRAGRDIQTGAWQGCNGLHVTEWTSFLPGHIHICTPYFVVTDDAKEEQHTGYRERDERTLLGQGKLSQSSSDQSHYHVSNRSLSLYKAAVG